MDQAWNFRLSRLKNLLMLDDNSCCAVFQILLDLFSSFEPKQEIKIGEKRNEQVNHLSANPTKWLNTLKQSSNLLMNCLSMFDHFVWLLLKGLNFFRHYNLAS